MRKSVLLVCSITLTAFVAPAFTKAEETTQSTTIATSSTALKNESSERLLSTETSTAVTQESSADQNTASSTQPQTAVVNGEVVELEPPHKEGQAEANATQAPKEELMEGNARNFRAAAASVPMYRLYNPNSGEHFYTKTTSERDHLRSAGWRYEGIGWQAPTGGNPVYRLYNPNAGDHHYSATRFA